MPYSPLELAKACCLAADDKLATDIKLLDLTALSDVCDYFVICTVANNPQMGAVREAVEDKARLNFGAKPLSAEGRGGSSWLLLDYGTVVVHVFKPEARDYYRLERLWGDAAEVDLGLGDRER